MRSDNVEAADVRRALALVAHHLDGNAEGMGVVLREAMMDERACGRAGRSAHVFTALLQLITMTAPWLATPDGREWMAHRIALAARVEADDDEQDQA